MILDLRGENQGAQRRASARRAADIPRDVDVVVVGGGHAGIEAAWVLGRSGVRTALVTFDTAALGRMSCNPSIGGLAKGQLVREIDALGGAMGRLIDRTGIHFRMLNHTKGAAVQAPRAQADRDAYTREAIETLAALGDVMFIEAEVTEILAETGFSKQCAVGLRLDRPDWTAVQPGGAHSTGAERCDPEPDTCPEAATLRRLAEQGRLVRVGAQTEITARAIVLTVGTFLNGKVFTGLDPRPGGRRGEPPARGLSASLGRLGLELGRLKTGTPPRLDGDTIHFARLAAQPGHEPPPRFSFYDDAMPRNRIVCHLTRTGSRTHDIIRAALDRSPLYGGLISGIGPRYCPSIEDKVMRFPARGSHQVFLEPEGLQSSLIYPNGISTSLPADVQASYVRSIEGLEDAVIVHPGYAVEYDFLLTSQIDGTLAVRGVEGLFAAGQVNGTSGYEEAAAQGLMAGINARAHVGAGPPLRLTRNQAYIGVLLDDLVTKVPTEPYRMFTSQSEYRLILRQDNADRRLTAVGHAIGLVNAADCRQAADRWDRIDAERRQLYTTRVKRTSLERYRAMQTAGGVQHRVAITERDCGRPFAELLRRPGADMRILEALGYATSLPAEEWPTIEAEIKYEGYVRKQEREITRARSLEQRRIPEAVLDDPPPALSTESREQLRRHRPHTLGQALRVPGITPSDVFLLAVTIRARDMRGAKPADGETPSGAS